MCVCVRACVRACVRVCVCVLAGQNCLLSCNRGVYLSVVSCLILIAISLSGLILLKRHVLDFVPDPRV